MREYKKHSEIQRNSPQQLQGSYPGWAGFRIVHMIFWIGLRQHKKLQLAATSMELAGVQRWAANI